MSGALLSEAIGYDGAEWETSDDGSASMPERLSATLEEEQTTGHTSKPCSSPVPPASLTKVAEEFAPATHRGHDG